MTLAKLAFLLSVLSIGTFADPLPPAIQAYLKHSDFVWRCAQDARFRFCWEASLDPDQNLAAARNSADPALRAILRRIHAAGYDNRIYVFFVASPERMAQLIGYRGEGRSQPKQHAIFFVPTPIRPDLTHELSHEVLTNRWGAAEPWIEEGFASLIAEPRAVHAICLSLTARDAMLPLTDLVRPEWNSSIYSHDVTYMELGGFTGYLEKRYGLERFQQIWRLGSKSIPRILGKSVPILEQEWKLELQREIELPLGRAHLAISTSSLPAGLTNVPYSTTVAVTGGAPVYTWSLVSGTLPPGLSLAASSGVISGTTSQQGSYSFTVGVSDSLGNQTSKSYSFSIAVAVPTYYVATVNGNDSWSGQFPTPNQANTDGPFKSLAKAQIAMRGSSIKTATLRAGTYSIASVLAFESTDNGETWTAYTGETAILDGGSTGTVTISGVKTLSIFGLTFTNLNGTGHGGSGGIVFNGSTKITFQYNTFLNCNNACISGSGSFSSVYDSNTFNGMSPGETSAGDNFAINLWGGSTNNQITHNLFENLQGGGVGFAAGPSDPPNSNNVVDRNTLQNVNMNANDIGALYMYDASHSAVGNKITNNLIFNNGGTGYASNNTKAIYLDDLMSNVLVSGNTCQHCGHWAFQVHGGDHNVFTNNIFDVSTPETQLGLYQTSSLADPGMTGNVFQKNLVYFSNSAPSSLYAVYTTPGDASMTSSSNLYYSATGATIPNGAGIVDTNPVYANPQFTNPPLGDYSMPASSPAYTAVEFQTLPTDQGPSQAPVQGQAQQTPRRPQGRCSDGLGQQRLNSRQSDHGRQRGLPHRQSEIRTTRRRCNGERDDNGRGCANCCFHPRSNVPETMTTQHRTDVTTFDLDRRGPPLSASDCSMSTADLRRAG